MLLCLWIPLALKEHGGMPFPSSFHFLGSDGGQDISEILIDRKLHWPTRISKKSAELIESKALPQ